MNKKTTHCCQIMQSSLQNDHIPIRYTPLFREYWFVRIYDFQASIITYCPWCRTELPLSLRTTYFNILKEKYNIQDLSEDLICNDNNELPQDFLTDKWWRSRGL